MAPDFPYRLAALGISATSSDDRYEPFLNPRNTHSLGWGLRVDLCFASARSPPSDCRAGRSRHRGYPPVSACRDPNRRPVCGPGLRHALRLPLSALVGIVSHLARDGVTHGDGFLVGQVALSRDPVPEA